MNIEGLDKLDHAILETIRENARMSYSDIGDRVGLSRVAVKNRMEAMEKAGVIKGYQTIIDETKTPEGLGQRSGRVLSFCVCAEKAEGMWDSYGWRFV